MEILVVGAGSVISDQKVTEDLEHYDAVIKEESHGSGRREGIILAVYAEDEDKLNELMDFMADFDVIEIPPTDMKNKGMYYFNLDADHNLVYDFLEEHCRIDLY